VSDGFDPEPPIDPDAGFRNFMRGNFLYAATALKVEPSSPPTFGWRIRSIGAEVRSVDGPMWLRVISEELSWSKGTAWTGNKDANIIVGVAKPDVRAVLDWDEPGWRRQRAELMTLLPGEMVSPTPHLAANAVLNAEWWRSLRQTLDVLKAVPTDRNYADQARVQSRIRKHFPHAANLSVDAWSTAHGDLHWSNLLAPRFGLIDWELWGRGPRGADVATLIGYSVLVPEMVQRLEELFIADISGPTGRIAQLYVIARLLDRIQLGDHLDLEGPLRLRARALI